MSYNRYIKYSVHFVCVTLTNIYRMYVLFFSFLINLDVSLHQVFSSRNEYLRDQYNSYQLSFHT